MKKIIFSASVFLLALTAKAQTTIYNGSGTLLSSRTVNMGSASYLHFKPISGYGLYMNSLGNVGIGTTPSSQKLTVLGNIQANAGYFTKVASDGANFGGNNVSRVNSSLSLSAGYPCSSTTDVRTFHFMDFPQSDIDPQGSTIWFAINNRNNYTRYRFRAVQNAGSQFYLFDRVQNEYFKIEDDGNNAYLSLPKEESYVTIGTNSYTDGTDTYKLSVNGNVRANRVKVYTSWADYVFEENYDLPTLEEVESHIKENGHLKDIPSAQEVEQNGIELGEMNKLLLQKIEELTLYTIELNKEINKLKEQINKD